MSKLRLLSVVTISCLSAWMTASVSAQISTSRRVPASGTASFTTSNSPFLSTGGPELDPSLANTANHDTGSSVVGRVMINRRLHPAFEGTANDKRAPRELGQHVDMAGSKDSGAARTSQTLQSAASVDVSIDGLNLNDQRYANGGNQFTLEPPDQGLCVGNGYVLESVNDALRAYSTDGSPVTGTIALNQFYGYAPAINRSTGQFGPEITDPSCLYDRSSKRWFQLVLTLDHVGTTSALSGKNHLDLAVSNSPDPLGTWTIYHIPAQNDGTDGTPNHQCPGGPCLGDYPHIGADKNGIYITTNEFALFAPGFTGAQIYALSKEELAEASSSINVVEYNTADPSTQTASGLPGFTVWPAVSAGPSPAYLDGTEYFLSSLAIFSNTGIDNRLQLWSLTHTEALNHDGAPRLTSSIVNTEGYGIPGFARQPGTGTDGVGQAPNGGNVHFPLGQCLNDPICSTQHILGFPDPVKEVISPLAANDSRMQQVFYADGKLYASVGTGLAFSATQFSEGLAYFVLHTEPSRGTPTATVVNQGYLGDPNLDMTYGTVAVTRNGKGIISFTATGPSNYPSMAYATLDAKNGAGAVQFAAAGRGAQDGFTGYQIFGFNPRWGDYGAAAVDGKSIWFAQEYINTDCALSRYLASRPVGTCNGERTILGDWGTRIAKVTP